MATSKTSKTGGGAAAKTKNAAKATTTFSAAEREAMEERAREAKAENSGKAGGEKDLLAKIAEMDASDRAMAEAIHRIVTAAAPGLAPKTWYGMPAWADKDGKAVCYFTPAGKFKERYASFGFNASARLDDGNMWPTSFAVLRIGDAEEKRIVDLVKKAVG